MTPAGTNSHEHVRQLARIARAAGAQLARAGGPERRAILLAAPAHSAFRRITSRSIH